MRDEVLGRGQTWLDRAFVVSDWYGLGLPATGATARAGRWACSTSASSSGRSQLLKYAALAGIGLIFSAVMFGAAVASRLRWARTIFGPLERMAATMQRVEARRAGRARGPAGAARGAGRDRPPGGHLDQLLGVIDDKTAALQRWNAELDAKVAERTLQLEAAQQQLVRNEKLAAVGQLTASIAHEVNNPIAVIQGNLDLVRELLEPGALAAVRPS